MNPILYVSFGLLIGVIIGWLLHLLRPPRVDARLEEELRKQIATQVTELTRTQDQLNQKISACAAAETAKTELARQLTAERQQIETLQQRFTKDFEAISNKLLLENVAHFKQQSSDSLGTLLNPLKDKLKEVKDSLDSTRTETVKHSALLKDEVGRIGLEAANLSKALRGEGKVLGNWGENMLDQILEKSGLQEGLHYTRQRSGKNDEGAQFYLDVVIQLPESRHLVIDSKVSLRRYQDFVNSTDAVTRPEHLKAHVQAIRKHCRDLGGKRYQDIYGISAPDFVLMYVPIEGAFFSAMTHEPELFSEALEANVVLVTNSTLLATLRTVAHVWRLMDQQKNAMEIADRGGKLYDKFAGFVEDLNAIGKSLNYAREAWDAALKKLSAGPGNLVWQAEQLKKMGAKATKELQPELLGNAAPDPDIPAVIISRTG